MSPVVMTLKPSQEEKQSEAKEMDYLSVQGAPKAGPNDFIMVRSKVAPVLLPVHKGLLPHHIASLVQSNTPTAPPGLPPPVHSPLPFQSYLEVTLPQTYPFHPADLFTKNTIASNSLIFLLEYIWKFDPTAMIAKFPTYANYKIAALPIAPEASRNREFPNTVQTVGYYLHNARFHPSGVAGKARIFLLHTVELSQLVQTLNRSGSYTFAPATIQTADLATTVWLLGSTEHTNCKDLTKALLNTPEFRARPEVGLLCRQRWVKLYSNERRSDVTAVHISTAQHHYTFVLETLQKLYNTRSGSTNGGSGGGGGGDAAGSSTSPPYGNYHAVPDIASYGMSLNAARALREGTIEYRKLQKEVLRQCTSLKMDLKGLIPFEGSSLLHSQQLQHASDDNDDRDSVLFVDRHPCYAFVYTFSWHQRMTPQAMKRVNEIVEQLKALAAEKKQEEAAETKEDCGETKDEEEDLHESQSSLIPSTVLWHKTSTRTVTAGGD